MTSLDRVYGLMRLTGRYADVAGANSVTVHCDDLVISFEEGEVMATGAGLAEAIGESWIDHPAVTLDELERALVPDPLEIA